MNFLFRTCFFFRSRPVSWLSNASDYYCDLWRWFVFDISYWRAYQGRPGRDRGRYDLSSNFARPLTAPLRLSNFTWKRPFSTVTGSKNANRSRSDLFELIGHQLQVIETMRDHEIKSFLWTPWRFYHSPKLPGCELQLFHFSISFWFYRS